VRNAELAVSRSVKDRRRTAKEDAMDNSEPRPAVSSAVCYQDPKAALKWLENAFGFEPSMVILGPNDELMHSEMRFGDGIVMVASEWSSAHKSPKSIDGSNTQTVHVQLNEDIDAHCARARKAGAVIQMEPTTQFYGDRTYRALDPEGHIWSFGQTVKRMTSDEWDKAMGVRTKTRL
jgi:uncharacterized glyoxalase superfamily protein PhnB